MIHRFLCLLLALTGSLLPGIAAAQPLQPVPPLQARVTDLTATLQVAQRDALEQKLAAFEGSTGTQIAVLMVSTTAPEDIAAYAYRVASEWKIGRKNIGDGLLLVVAKDDRRVRIEVARTLEGSVPDLAAKRVIDNAITPRFKQGDFAGGMNDGVEQLMQLVRQETLPQPSPAPAAETLEDTLGAVAAVYIAIAFFVARFAGLLAALMLTLPGLLPGLGLAWLGVAATGNHSIGFWCGMIGLPVSAVLAILVVNNSGGGGGSTLGGSGWSGSTSGSGGRWGGSGGGGGGGFSSGGGGSFGGGGSSGSW